MKRLIIRKAIFAGALVFLAIGFRLWWHLGPNIEYVTCATLLAAFYLGKPWNLLVPFLAMVLSDSIIGNTNIFLFTWSGFLIIAVATLGACRKFSVASNRSTTSVSLSDSSKIWQSSRRLFLGTGIGIFSAFFFYLWTNFGVWLLDNWGMYAKTLSGLIACYIAGLPFLKMNLLGNLVFVPASFFIVEILTIGSETKIFLSRDNSLRSVTKIFSSSNRFAQGSQKNFVTSPRIINENSVSSPIGHKKFSNKL